jgi:formylglycine-generating enzyme required for sulfatase activity
MTVGLTLMVGLCLALKCCAEGDLPADFKNYTETLTTLDGAKITFEMIAVPGGTFTMGSPTSEKGRKADEGPPRKVTVGPFWISKTEVTWDEYDTFMESVPQTPKGDPGEPYEADAITGPTLPYGDQYRGFSSGKKPAIGIGWYGGMVYCKWLSKETGKLYRLPTEAEWEYACRAGTTGKYSFGDDDSKLGDYAWYTKNAKNMTHDVGTKKPNPWGIHDMHGNVAEWCLDWYGAKYPAGDEKDPKGAAEGKNHATRGGSWKSTPSQTRAARRDSSKDWWLVPDPQEPKSKWWLVPTNFLGFRVIRPLEGEKPTMPDIEEGRQGL